MHRVGKGKSQNNTNSQLASTQKRRRISNAVQLRHKQKKRVEKTLKRIGQPFKARVKKNLIFAHEANLKGRKRMGGEEWEKSARRGWTATTEGLNKNKLSSKTEGAKPLREVDGRHA